MSAAHLLTALLARAVAVVLTAAGAVGTPLVRRVRQRREARLLSRASGARQVTRAADEHAEVDTPDLVRRSASALVELDDAVRATNHDLPLARVRLGPRRAQELEAVLKDALAAHAQVFQLRQTLDDAVPDSERAVRDAATQIVRTCRRATARLGAQRKAIDEVRALEADVETVLVALGDDAARWRRRAESTGRALDALTALYSPDALVTFASDLDQATLLLAEVDETLTRGRARAVAGARPGAVGCARVAEEALAQVARLLESVESADAELAAAGARLDASIASLTADLADVERLACDNPQLAAHTREAQESLAAAGAARPGTGDPLAVLRRLAAAELALDAALAPSRAAEEQLRRAASLVNGALSRLDVALRATTLYIESRRGVVGSSARTRLVEAERLRVWASGRRATDPVAALADVQRAERLVAEAEKLALRDVRRVSRYGASYGAHGATGGIRSGWHRRGSAWGDPEHDPPHDEEDSGGGLWAEEGFLGALADWRSGSGDDGDRDGR
ncbi:hypothetical protein [Cellulomonas sp. S1-8]|uniref:hypothetical protein n=1 Tax=Cellulomonas sp. S1-8 TaxID=2904790 RepID=UPI002243CC4F|nr:hypothetical protein [Cellulomonas sp. S1-8]UZN04106.1 hypothetical protein OKX07_03995 [Cellulomonas sp. S1-8]